MLSVRSIFPKRLWNFCKNLPMPKPMRPSADIFSRCKTKQKNNCPDTDSLKELHEAEHDMLCRLIQIYFNDETKPVFKRYLTVVCLFPDYVMDTKLLLSILNYYNIFNKKTLLSYGKFKHP